MTDEQERAAVVAWLRECANGSAPLPFRFAAWAADMIERGDHLTDRPAP